VRWKWFYLLAIGLAFFAGAAVCGVLAIGQAETASAYSHAAACPGSAAFDADCVQTVSGSVTAVEEFSGKDSHYELDVQAGSHAIAITFPSDDPMLGYAADGDPAEVTVWRGIPVAVTTDGRSAVPSSLPGYAAATDLGYCMESLGVSVFFLVAPLLQWRQRRTGRQVLSPLGVAGLLAGVLTALDVAATGFMLTGHPDEPATVFTVAAVALVLPLGLGAWAGVSAKRHQAKHPELTALRQPTPLPRRERPSTPRPRPAVPLRASLGYRLRPSNWLPMLRALLKSYGTPALVVLVLLGLFFTANDAPNARAFRDAPACQGETNLNVCVGDFTAAVNGVRTTSPNADSASISYATDDGAINAWGGFSGSAEVLANTAQAEQTSGAPVRIEVWRGAIVGAEIGGSWHWATNNPPGDTPPAIFLAVSLTLLLLLIRYRAHRPPRAYSYATARTGATQRALIRDDLGQVAASAAGYALLICGYWYGALLVAAVLGWMAWTAWRNARNKII
jgi:hypothetical protein